MKFGDPIKILREEGGRITSARKNILELFSRYKYPVSVQEILLKLNGEKKRFNKTTVYRQIEELLKYGFIEKVHFADGINRYEAAKLDHHHHLVCLSCKKVSDIELVESFKKQEKIINKQKKFKVVRHSLEFFGYCFKCQ